MDPQRLIPLGVITAPHGVRGQVKILTFTADPNDLTAYGMLTDKTGTRSFDVKIHSQNKEVVIASVKGVTSREQAEGLRKIELCVPRASLPETDGDEFYHEDLVGLKITREDGSLYGTVNGVHNFGAGDMLAIKLASGGEELFPFARSTFPVIDVKKRHMTIVPPEVLQAKLDDE